MTRTETVQTVIKYLGRIAAGLAVGAISLTFYLLWLAGKSGSVDPVAVGAVGAITTLLGTTLGALGAMLVSTSSGANESELEELAALIGPPAPIPVTGPQGGPVAVVETPPEPT